MNTNHRPSQTNLIHHKIITRGEFPRTTFIAVFYYANGSVREFDGREWTKTLSGTEGTKHENL
jgi:hypothetical protein